MPEPALAAPRFSSVEPRTLTAPRATTTAAPTSMRVVELTRIDRLYVNVTVTATLDDGTVVTPASVDVAVLPPRTTPTASTVWTTPGYTAGVATVLVAGPDADPTEALAVPTGGGDLWVKVTDNPEVQAALAARIVVN